jgi:osmotically-inducible protein OsmY
MQTDILIQREVMEQLNSDPMLTPSQIGVSVKNGIVTLSGSVDTYYKKTKAENAVKKVRGVKALAEQLRVGVSPFFKRTDSEIAESVINALREHTSIPEEKIQIKVEDGVVTLQGELDWYYQKKLAEDTLSGLAGVREIINAIKVKPFVSSEDVSRRITDTVKRNATLDASHIHVQVVGNKAILTGEVRSLSEKEDAAAAALSAPGIISIENLITVNQLEYSFEEE